MKDMEFDLLDGFLNDISKILWDRFYFLMDLQINVM